MKIHSIWNQHPQMQKDLHEVIAVIEKHIKIRDKKVEDNIKNLIYGGGKLLRPAYTLLCSKIGPTHEHEKAIAVAAALEVLHMATLIHDDIIDDADTRRGNETIQAKYGKHYAVYTGDYLFCVCFKILAKYSGSLSDIDFSTKSMEKLLLGELAQMNSRYQMDKTVRQYLTQISGKTAQLFALSCYTGATVSDANQMLQRRAWNIGHNIGMAFQVIDDVLDYTNDDTSLGKPVLNDVKQGVYSLPLLFAMREDKAAFRPLLEKRLEMSDADLLEVLALIEKYDGVGKARDIARKYTEKSLHLMKKLPEGQYKQDMLEITSTILKREV